MPALPEAEVRTRPARGRLAYVERRSLRWNAFCSGYRLLAALGGHMSSSNRRWTSEEIEKLKTMAGQYSRKTIADNLGRGPSSAAVKAHQLRISLRWKNLSRYAGVAEGS
jgi:hypothetical protein